ncbi:GNAT family N-acetyltransferase [Halobacillus sp. Marseille-Q1614]|uniref:GNAT family N-acetyltransferase n=1 Tax=Halobacillus sp. Marseille-Q1614 TaxID=2709134 RepID=UPI001570E899|nr:GNAT family N-acetyltransferase [Halobacillus sp. Marseille-Q1614]
MKAEFTKYDQDIDRNISFVSFNLDEHFPLIFKWMHEDHVIPFWGLNKPKEQLKSHLVNAVNDHHQSLYIGYIDGTPMSYWEAYWVKGDIIEDYYEPAANDQGIHLLIGDTDYLGKGLSLPLLRAMVQFQFQHRQTKKIVSEPDYRNEKMIHVFEQCGFENVKKVELPDKTAQLMFCSREKFEERWSHEYSETHL